MAWTANELFFAIEDKSRREMSMQSTQVDFQLGLLRSAVREHLEDGTPWEEITQKIKASTGAK